MDAREAPAESLRMDDDGSPRPSKRARKSCERCRQRKQRCHGYPQCSNCTAAKVDCKQPASAIEEYRSGPNQALLDRISYLEAQLATYTSAAPPGQPYAHWQHNGSDDSVSNSSPGLEKQKTGGIADVVGFLSLGGERAYIGSSSGFSLASSLGQMVQATVWNKALTATVNDRDHQPKIMSLAEVKKNSAGPPNDDMGARILDAYFTRTHNRYPFLDRKDIMERHANRFIQKNESPVDQFGTFKIYMIYAIGATLLRLTESYDYTPPENFFMTALQYISAARESHSVHNIQAMTLLCLYNLRSPSNSGIWYMIGLAVRTCVDLGLHREAHYAKISPYEGQLRRRLFWTVYFLERVIAVSLGRPYSIADRDIDVSLPLEIDDTVRDDGLIARTQAVAPSPTFQASRPSSNLTLGIQCISLMRLESHIQSTFYRVDKPLSSLISGLSPVLKLLEDWHSTLPPLIPSETDYLNMHYYKAIRLAIQPFLNLLPADDPRIAVCLHASGQISQIFKRLHQRDSYGHSFIALHSVFISGVTMCYCLFLAPNLWAFSVSNDLRACSSALFVMAERTPVIKKYRDALETVIGATMDFMARASASKSKSTSPTMSRQPLPQQRNTEMGPPPPRNSTSYPGPDSSPGSTSFSPRESYLRDPLKAFSAPTPPSSSSFNPHPHNLASADYGATYTPFAFEAQPPEHQTYGSPGTGMGLGDDVNADGDWLLSLCEGDGYSLQMLNEMMRFEPSIGA